MDREYWAMSTTPSVFIARAEARAKAQARALALAEHVFGNTHRIRDREYWVRSSLSARVSYRCEITYVKVYIASKWIGTLCLQTSPEYPLWDGIVSRILLLQHDEVAFLRAANFWYEDGSTDFLHPQPMTREKVSYIYGERATKKWEEAGVT